ncbi:MAG: NAD(+) diphosphatase [Gammaproteobacteria bacterium]|nr:MAG: NAD(+) diphosphatase [Gammaproteobacteria bacterium]
MQNAIQCYVIADEKFLCTHEGAIVLLAEPEFLDLRIDLISRFSLKHHEGHEVHVLAIAPTDIPGFQWLGLRSFLEFLSEPEFQTAGRALQILRWNTDHQFCGRCGKPTVQHFHDLAKSCIACGIDFYPRLSPCIITLVTRGDECLLAWHKRSKVEKYSCLAGFIEIGESPEQTLMREVMEEVGLAVKNIRYIESQPWPFPGQLMLGYFADYEGGDIQVDQNEILVAKWFRYDQLPSVPSATTISGRLINAFVQARRNNKLTI